MPEETKTVRTRSCYLSVSCSGAWPEMQLSFITKALAPPNGLGRQHGPRKAAPSITQYLGGCPRHIPTGHFTVAHTATLALLGTCLGALVGLNNRRSYPNHCKYTPP